MIKLRPHHLLCIPRFKLGGYDAEIRNKTRAIQKKIKQNPQTKVKMIYGPDDICASCCFCINKKCAKEKDLYKVIRKIDEKVRKYLKIRKNQIFPAKEIFGLALEKIPNKRLKNFCGKCEFLRFCSAKKGLNQSFVKHLK
jgi:hypothetical protein